MNETPSVTIPTEPASVAARASRAGVSTSLLTVLLWPLAVACATGYAVEQRAQQRVDALLSAQLAQRPPIAVVDTAGFIARAPGLNQQQKIEQGLASAMDAAAKLKAAGFLVLDADAAFAAPSELEVRAP